MSTLAGDIRFSLRTLRKSPGFTLVCVLTMALGIGALSSIFSVVNAVLLRALPFEDPSRLVLVDGVSEKDEGERALISYPDFLDLRRHQRSLEDLAARTEGYSLTLRTEQGPEMVRVEIVSASYFRILGVKPDRGRAFLPEEDQVPAVRRVALISDHFWHSHFAGDSAAVGKVLSFDDQSYTVVGVLPAGFRGLSDAADVWLPLSAASTFGPDYTEKRGFRWLHAVGRLKPGVSLEQAREDLDAISRQLEADFAYSNEGIRAAAMPLREAWFGELRRKLLILLAGGLFLLLIVCTNLANLLLARFVARRRDLSLRMALGARRTGLVRQVLAESVLLALLGCGAGLLVARWSTGLLIKASGIPLKSFVSVEIDLVVVGVILTVSLFAGLLFGLVPALVLSSKLRLYEVFNDNSRRGMYGESHQRFQNALIVGEVAAALVLLVCAGLMTKGFQRLNETDLGFDPKQLLTMRMSIKGEGFKENPAVWNLATESLDRLRAVPGISAVALEGPELPTTADWSGAAFTLEDQPETELPVLAGYHFVSPGYFSVLGVPVVKGRDLTSVDVDGAQQTVVVSQSLADQYWPGQNPIGKRLKRGRRNPKPPAPPSPWLTVVGVVRNVKHSGLVQDDRPLHDVYVPLLQKVPRTPATLGLLVRTSVPPAAVAQEVRQQLRDIAPDLPVYDIAVFEERLAQQTAGGRSFVLLMSLFAFFALSLAAVGVYGVVSYSVSNRTQEIGLRMALGAQLRDVLRLVIGQGGRLALMGVALGLLLALLVTPVLTSWLYGVSPLDKIILGGMSVLLLGVAMAASYIPARRAAKVAPFQALRLE
ncbi:MAG TPA: ABC transporter permease [Thermoanaerobaculia bacterium]